MSEREQTTAEEVIERARAEKDRIREQKFNEAVFGLSPDNDLSQEQQNKQFDEASEYVRHLEKMAKREDTESADDYYHSLSESDTRYIDNLHEQALNENQEFDDAKKAEFKAEKERLAEVEAKIKNNRDFRRLLMVATQLAKANAAKLGEGKNDEKLIQYSEDKEEQFQILWDRLQGDGLDDDALEYILDHAFASPDEFKESATPTVDVESDDKEVHEGDSEVDGTPTTDEGFSPEEESSPETSEENSEATEKEGLDLADLRKDDEIEPLPPLPETTDESEQEDNSEEEKTRGFWNKTKGFVKNKLFNRHWWGAQWSTGYHRIINWHVTEEMTDEEVEKQRHKNRRNFALGAAAVLVGTALGFGIDHLVDSNAHHHLADLHHGHNPHGSGGESEAQKKLDEAAKLQAEQQAEQASAYHQNFNISSGEGGIQLFHNLGLNESTWYKYAETLAKLFPDEFERSPSGNDIWLSHSGWLSTDAENFIKNIPKT